MITQLCQSVRRWLSTESKKAVAAVAVAPVLPVLSGPPLVRPNLSQLARLDVQALPLYIRESAAAMEYIALLGGLDWEHFPQRQSEKKRPGPQPAPDAPVMAAFLVKLNKGLTSMAELRKELVGQPALTWALGFPLVPSADYSYGFDVKKSLPSHRHLSRLLRKLPNAQMQFLLQGTVQLLKAELPAELPFGDEISLDTKHIIAWVRENNPKEHIRGGRFHKERQPKGDKDCKVGFKANENHPLTPASPATGAEPAGQTERAEVQSRSAQLPAATVEMPAAVATPTTQGLPASGSLPKPKDGDYYWGYASGVVATKVDDWCEVVLAEMTQTFDQADESYFHPLMAQTERNLGKKPKFGALDGAYDTFYVHEYFTLAGGFAAVPWADRADHHKTFNADRLPLCAAGLAMPLKSKVQKKSHCLVPHEIGRYVCPLLFPEQTGEVCPIDHKNWQRTGNDKGCITTLPTSVGSFARHTLDRESPAFKALYDQRTAVERINSQAVALDIERPHLRNQCSISNQNTLIYVLINLRALQRVQEKKAKQQAIQEKKSQMQQHC